MTSITEGPRPKSRLPKQQVPGTRGQMIRKALANGPAVLGRSGVERFPNNPAKETRRAKKHNRQVRKSGNGNLFY